MANTRKPQSGRKSRRQKQPATIDLEANPPQEPENNTTVNLAAKSSGTQSEEAKKPAAKDAGKAEGVVIDESGPEGVVEGAPAEEVAADKVLHDAPVKEKRGGIGAFLQAAITAVIGGGVALGGANLMDKLGTPKLPQGADPAGLTQAQEEIQSLKAQLESLQQSVTDSSTAANTVVSSALTEELAVAKTAANDALQRSQQLETRLDEINAAILENGPDGSNGATAALGDIEQQLAELERGAETRSGELEARLEQIETAASGSELKTSIDENRQAISSLKEQIGAISTQISEKILPSMQQVEAAAEAAISGQKVARSVSARALSNALEQGGAFTAELASAEALTGEAAEYERLRAIAGTGIQTPAQLLSGFDDVANRILKVESRPQEDAGIVERFMASAKSLVVIRPAGPVDGDSSAAVLSRVEAALKDGNAGDALTQWETLPGPARQMGPEWEQALRDRIEAQSLIGSIIEKLSAGQG